MSCRSAASAANRSRRSPSSVTSASSRGFSGEKHFTVSTAVVLPRPSRLITHRARTQPSTSTAASTMMCRRCSSVISRERSA